MKARLNGKTKILTVAVMLSSNMLFNLCYSENITIESVEDYNNFTDSRISGSRDGNVSGNNLKISLSNDFEIKKQIYGSRGENALFVDNNNRLKFYYFDLIQQYIKQLLEQKRQDLEEIQQEAEHKKRVEIDAKRRQAENDYINQMRCVAHQYGNMSIDICTSSGRREHIQSGYIPPQARPVSHQQFQIRGNSVQDVTQQLKNILIIFSFLFCQFVFHIC